MEGEYIQVLQREDREYKRQEGLRDIKVESDWKKEECIEEGKKSKRKMGKREEKSHLKEENLKERERKLGEEWRGRD